MHRIVRAAAVAAAASAASWCVRRWLERRALRPATSARAIQVWENEGGRAPPAA